MKKCKITNGPYCWILEVDDETVYFNGRDSAEYFEKHYKELGYEVEFYGEILNNLY